MFEEKFEISLYFIFLEHYFSIFSVQYKYWNEKLFLLVYFFYWYSEKILNSFSSCFFFPFKIKFFFCALPSVWLSSLPFNLFSGQMEQVNCLFYTEVKTLPSFSSFFVFALARNGLINNLTSCFDRLLWGFRFYRLFWLASEGFLCQFDLMEFNVIW